MKYRFVVVLLVVAVQGLYGQEGVTGFVLPSLAPAVQKDGTILFRLRAPAARQVFVKLEGTTIAMQKNKTGIWSARSEKLEPDIYTYTFLVDSLPIVDPANTGMRSSYAGTGASLITVPGNPAASWELQNTPHGAVTHHVFKSTVIGDNRDCYVYTPPGYDAKDNKEYPVLYLLHGMGDDARGWIQTGKADVIMDNLIAAGRVVPMILVTTFGYGVAGAIAGPQSFDQFTKSLIDEIIPLVERKYRASSMASQRAIAGLSMGGAQATFAGLRHPELFKWIGAFSSAFIMYGISEIGHGSKFSSLDSVYTKTFPLLDSGINKQINLLWLSCGKSDFLLGNHYDFMKWLSARKINFQSKEPPGAHSWMVWRRNLVEFTPLLFR